MYFDLLQKSITAMRAADPDMVIVAPGAASPNAKPDIAFLERLMQLGMLELVDGVSIHPYTAMAAPETLLEHYAQVRQLIDRYAPPGKAIPIIATEWGYEVEVDGMSTALISARYIIRHFLIGVWQQIPLQSVFSWQNSLFGVVQPDGMPRPGYYALQTLIDVLGGYSFVARLDVPRPEEQYLLQFSNCGRTVIAAWLSESTRLNGDETPRTEAVVLGLPPGRAELVSIEGNRRVVEWASSGLQIMLSEDPQYIVLDQFDPETWAVRESEVVSGVVIYPGRCNVRAEATTESAVIGRLVFGDTVLIRGVDENGGDFYGVTLWYNIEYVNPATSEIITGWVHSSLLEVDQRYELGQ
jgi:hypothetical protein